MLTRPNRITIQEAILAAIIGSVATLAIQRGCDETTNSLEQNHMSDRPALALPPEIAEQIHRREAAEQAGKKLLQQLTFNLWTALVARRLDPHSPVSELGGVIDRLLDEAHEDAQQIAVAMCARYGFHFTIAPGPTDQSDAPA